MTRVGKGRDTQGSLKTSIQPKKTQTKFIKGKPQKGKRKTNLLRKTKVWEEEKKKGKENKVPVSTPMKCVEKRNNFFSGFFFVGCH